VEIDSSLVVVAERLQHKLVATERDMAEAVADMQISPLA